MSGRFRSKSVRRDPCGHASGRASGPAVAGCCDADRKLLHVGNQVFTPRELGSNPLQRFRAVVVTLATGAALQWKCVRASRFALRRTTNPREGLRCTAFYVVLVGEKCSDMAIGFGFNKAKVLSSAEKFVQQGKLQNAVAEYEKIAKQDPKDLTVLNTIGDLYARLGHNDRASDFF